MSLKVELFIESTSGNFLTLDYGELLDESSVALTDESDNALAADGLPGSGALDDVNALLGGGTGAFGIPTDITSYVHHTSVIRGRSRELDEFQAGTCRLSLRNQDRTWDPSPWQTTGALGSIRPGKRLRVTEGTTVIFDGIVEDYDYEWSPGGLPEASLIAVDALGKLGRQTFLEWTTAVDQKPGARIGAVLDRTEVAFPTGSRDLDEGINVLQSDAVSYGSNVLNYLQLVAKSDAGRLFASRTGVLTYRSRDRLITGSVVAAFDDTNTNIQFNGLDVVFGSELLFTKVTIDREGGIAQTATAAASVITEFGVRPYPDTTPLLINDDTVSAGMAGYLLGRYQEPEAAISGLTLILDRLTSGEIATVAALEVGDLVTVDWTPGLPASGSAVSQTLVVEGVGYDADAGGTRTIGLQMSSAADRYGLILDDALFGLLDTAKVAY